MKEYLVILSILLCTSVAGGVYYLPDLPEEPGPTPRFVLILGYWAQSNTVCLAFGDSCGDSGPTWVIDYEAFDSIHAVGKRLADSGGFWPRKEILGLWELGEANRIPVKKWHTTETVEKHIEVQERDLVTDHYKIGGEEFEGPPR